MKKIKVGLFSIVALCAMSLVGLLIYQSIWIKGAILLANDQYDHRAIAALNSVSVEYMRHHGSTANYTNDSLVQSTDLIKVDRTLLDSLFSAYVEGNKLSSTYKYSLVNGLGVDTTFTDSDMQDGYYTIPLNQTVDSSNLSKPGSYQLRLYFPHKKQYIFEEMWLWLGGYAIFIVVIIFSLVYLIKTVLKQKYLAEEQADFVRSMIHELKTPVATIGMSSKVLKKAGTSVTDFDKLRSYAEIVDEENNRIWACVDSLLQMLTVNKRSLNLRKELVDVNSVAKAAVEGFSVATMSHPVTFIVQLDEMMPSILADKMHVRAVIDNLIDNAIKYSPVNSNIRITTERTKKNVIIIVEDNGKGIAKKDIKRVFNKFYRVSSEKKQGTKGFGLGLYYVKQVVGAHDGRVYIRSKLNKGTQMGVLFPIE